MFNNATQIVFEEQLKPQAGKFKFVVTELYYLPDAIRPIASNYDIEVPAEAVTFEKTRNGFQLKVEESFFDALKTKAEKLCCEIYVYPRKEN